MKIILSFIAILCFANVHAQTDSAATMFKTTSYSFGKIKKDVPASTEFKFINKGDKPLIIETAVAGCGCTTPDYPKTPIMKGKSGTIKVTYNAESAGKFTKTVTVKFANVKNPVVLTIDGDVVEKS